MCVCIYVYIYIYIYIYIYRERERYTHILYMYLRPFGASDNIKSLSAPSVRGDEPHRITVSFQNLMFVFVAQTLAI